MAKNKHGLSEVCATSTLVGTMVVHRDLLIESLRIQKIRTIDNQPDYMVGLIEWRESEIPLISLRGLARSGNENISYNHRVVVLRDIDNEGEQNYVAVACTGLPQFIEFNQNTFALDHDRKFAPPFAAYNVTIQSDDDFFDDAFLLDMGAIGEALDHINEAIKSSSKAA